jgi:hypothetical protein
MDTAEIHRELCTVNSKNVMSEGSVRQWCRVYKDGQTNVHDEERNCRPYVVSDDIFQNVDQKTCEG